MCAGHNCSCSFVVDQFDKTKLIKLNFKEKKKEKTKKKERERIVILSLFEILVGDLSLKNKNNNNYLFYPSTCSRTAWFHDKQFDSFSLLFIIFSTWIYCKFLKLIIFTFSSKNKTKKKKKIIYILQKKNKIKQI